MVGDTSKNTIDNLKTKCSSFKTKHAWLCSSFLRYMMQAFLLLFYCGVTKMGAVAINDLGLSEYEIQATVSVILFTVGLIGLGYAAVNTLWLFGSDIWYAIKNKPAATNENQEKATAES
jgi:hypothetical protein